MRLDMYAKEHCIELTSSLWMDTLILDEWVSPYYGMEDGPGYKPKYEEILGYVPDFAHVHTLE